MEIINGSAQREFRELERLMFEMMGRAPHLSLFQLTRLRGRVEDLLIMIRNEEESIPVYVSEVQEDLNAAAFILEDIRNDNVIDLTFNANVFDENQDSSDNYNNYHQNNDVDYFPDVNYDYETFDYNNMDIDNDIDLDIIDTVVLVHDVKAISKKKLRTVLQDICSICHDQHTFADIATMKCCGQHIGNECFKRWIESAPLPTCPCCRANEPGYVTYRPYAKKNSVLEVGDGLSSNITIRRSNRHVYEEDLYA